TYTDVVGIMPSLKKITDPRLSEIRYIRFRGNFTGFMRDFVTYGNIETKLGTIASDLNMKFPANGTVSYSGKVSTDNFNMGIFLGVNKLGTASFKGNVKGSGFSTQTLDADLDGTFS